MTPGGSSASRDGRNHHRLRRPLHRGQVGARPLGILGLALVIISAMDSIGNLPTTATFGWACVFFYLLAVVTYLIPVAFARPS